MIERNNAWYLGGSTHAHWVQVNGANTCSIRGVCVQYTQVSHRKKDDRRKGGGGYLRYG